MAKRSRNSAKRKVKVRRWVPVTLVILAILACAVLLRHMHSSTDEATPLVVKDRAYAGVVYTTVGQKAFGISGDIEGMLGRITGLLIEGTGKADPMCMVQFTISSDGADFFWIKPSMAALEGGRRIDICDPWVDGGK